MDKLNLTYCTKKNSKQNFDSSLKVINYDFTFFHWYFSCVHNILCFPNSFQGYKIRAHALGYFQEGRLKKKLIYSRNKLNIENGFCKQNFCSILLFSILLTYSDSRTLISWKFRLLSFDHYNLLALTSFVG